MHREELSRRHIYHSFNPQGVGIIAASLLSFGTEEQKHRWAVPILRAEITAALGHERTRCRLGSGVAAYLGGPTDDGDHFVVNGQKVWTSGAHDADVLLTFVRTDPDAPKHKGISVLLIPTDTEGVVCRPFASWCDREDLDFNEVFFSDVRVPVENLVGPLNDGWGVANGSLGHERTLLWLSFADRLDQLVEDFRPQRSLDRDRYATLFMDTQALRLLGSVAVAREARGEQDVPALSVLKLLGSEAVQAAGGLRAGRRWGRRSCATRRRPHRMRRSTRKRSSPAGSSVTPAASQAPSRAARRRSSARSSPAGSSVCPAADPRAACVSSPALTAGEVTQTALRLELGQARRGAAGPQPGSGLPSEFP